IKLDETSGIQEKLQSLARGELARGMLLCDPLGPPALLGGGLAAFQLLGQFLNEVRVAHSGMLLLKCFIHLNGWGVIAKTLAICLLFPTALSWAGMKIFGLALLVFFAASVCEAGPLFYTD